MELFEFFGIVGVVCIILAVFFAAKKKFKLHKIFAFTALGAILLHILIRFLE